MTHLIGAPLEGGIRGGPRLRGPDASLRPVESWRRQQPQHPQITAWFQVALICPINSVGSSDVSRFLIGKIRDNTLNHHQCDTALQYICLSNRITPIRPFKPSSMNHVDKEQQWIRDAFQEPICNIRWMNTESWDNDKTKCAADFISTGTQRGDASRQHTNPLLSHTTQCPDSLPSSSPSPLLSPLSDSLPACLPDWHYAN